MHAIRALRSKCGATHVRACDQIVLCQDLLAMSVRKRMLATVASRLVSELRDDDHPVLNSTPANFAQGAYHTAIHSGAALNTYLSITLNFFVQLTVARRRAAYR
jgi:hypothetical protein